MFALLLSVGLAISPLVHVRNIEVFDVTEDFYAARIEFKFLVPSLIYEHQGKYVPSLQIIVDKTPKVMVWPTGLCPKNLPSTHTTLCRLPDTVEIWVLGGSTAP